MATFTLEAGKGFGEGSLTIILTAADYTVSKLREGKIRRVVINGEVVEAAEQAGGNPQYAAIGNQRVINGNGNGKLGVCWVNVIAQNRPNLNAAELPGAVTSRKA